MIRSVFRCAALLSTGLAATTACSQPNVTIYGLLDAGLEAANGGKGTVKRVISGGSYGSRLGFRGAEDLGGGLSAVFRLESGFTLDQGVLAQGGRIFGREATVGLSKAGLGTVVLGRHPIPMSLAQSAVDAFKWMGGGGMISLTRSGEATRQLLPQVVAARVDNAISYLSPNWSGLELRVQAALGEGSPVLGRAAGVSARYLRGNVDVVAAYARQEGAGGDGGRIDSVTVGGSYNLGRVRLHAGYTGERNSCSTCTGALARMPGVGGSDASEFRLLNLGIRVPLGAFTGIAQVVRVQDRSDYTVDPGDRDATWVALGGEYALSRRTALYGALGSIDNRNDSRYALGSGGVQQPPNFVDAGDPRSTTLTLGMRHLF